MVRPRDRTIVQLNRPAHSRRRETRLVEKAQALAEKVRITGREIHFEPLHAPDRRIVHMALADIPGVRTYTVGQGLHRTIVIASDPRSGS